MGGGSRKNPWHPHGVVHSLSRGGCPACPAAVVGVRPWLLQNLWDQQWHNHAGHMALPVMAFDICRWGCMMSESVSVLNMLSTWRLAAQAIPAYDFHQLEAAASQHTCGCWAWSLLCHHASCVPRCVLVACRRLAQHVVNNLWAIASTTPFYSVKVRLTFGASNQRAQPRVRWYTRSCKAKQQQRIVHGAVAMCCQHV